MKEGMKKHPKTILAGYIHLVRGGFIEGTSAPPAWAGTSLGYIHLVRGGFIEGTCAAGG